MPDFAGRQTGRQPPFRPGVTVVLLVLYGLFIAYGTLIPFDFSATSQQVASKRHLFFAVSLAGASRSDLISNVLLFLPWGGLMAVWLAGRKAGFGLALPAAAVSGCALGGLVEAVQLFVPWRTSSWIDVAMNTTGSALGVVPGWWLARVIWPRVEPDLKLKAARHPLAVLTAVSALGVVMASMAPFDVSLDVGDIKASVTGARLVPFLPPFDHSTPAAEAWGWAGEVLVWTILGGLCALSLQEARVTGLGGAVITGAAAVGISTFIELVQLAIRSRRSDTTSVVLAAVGATIGALFVLQNARKTPHYWVRLALVLWALSISVEAWTPPLLVARGSREPSWAMFIPFWAFDRKKDIYAFPEMVVQTMRYLPLGALLALRFGEKSAWPVAAMGLGIGLAAEVGQFLLGTRSPKIADALCGAVGSWLGFILANYAAFLIGPESGPRAEAGDS